MLEELRRRNYAESTIHAYIRTVEHFAGHFHRPPDRLGLEHIRQYQAAMFTKWKLAPNTVTQRLAALRFFYIQVLKRGWSAAETPYPKRRSHTLRSATSTISGWSFTSAEARDARTAT
jgi:integrase/recombinase XerD